MSNISRGQKTAHEGEEIVCTLPPTQHGTSHDVNFTTDKGAHVVLPDPLLLHNLKGHELIVGRICRQAHLTINKRAGETEGNVDESAHEDTKAKLSLSLSPFKPNYNRSQCRRVIAGESFRHPTGTTKMTCRNCRNTIRPQDPKNMTPKSCCRPLLAKSVLRASWGDQKTQDRPHGVLPEQTADQNE